MAKTATKNKPSVPAVATRRNEVAKAGDEPAFLSERKMTGAGISTDQADNLIPMARVLQALSPEVEKRGVSYIKGAEPGDILIKNAPNPLIKGEEGFEFQPCYFEKKYVEWVPRQKGGGGGQGFVAAHDSEPDDTISRPDPENEERMIRVRKSNGNLVVETRYYGGYAVWDDGTAMPCVIPFQGSGHSVAKAWNLHMAQQTHNGNRVDMWAIYYRFTTKMRTKGQQSWFVFDIKDAGPEKDGIPTRKWVSDSDYARGEALNKSLSSQAMRFDRSAEDVGETATDTM